MTEFAKRRKTLMRQIGPNGILILPSAHSVQRNGDYEYPFRQNSDFHYLTGFDEPNSVLVIAPNRKEGEFILFNRPKNRSEEIWTGWRSGQEGARKQFQANQAFPFSMLVDKLPELLEGREAVHYPIGLDKAFDQVILNSLNKIRNKIRSGLHSPIAFIDIVNTLHEMRLIKSPDEIKLMRKVAEISANAHIRAMRACKPGMYEYELEAELLYEFIRHGARHTAYESIVGSGANTCILHYNANNQKIADGSLVLIDAGAEYDCYAADITRTFPANGRFSPEQKAIYEIVLAAQLAGIKAVKPGATFDAAQTAIVKVITEGLVELGILKGKVKELIDNHAYFDYYMHKSGHWLGLDVHDAGTYKVNGKWRKLEVGMVLTVEPGIYISADSKAHKRWHNIGVRIEDDVLVTQSGREVLSHGAPKTIAEIESLMSR